MSSLAIMDMITKLYSYQNGNVEVTLYSDGTMVREYEGIPAPDFPSSMDIKITDYCDLNCKFCHENSSIKGKHADLDVLFNQLEGLPAGVELALGGGNPLSHPDLINFLLKLKARGFIPNITVNQKHLSGYRDLITFLIQQKLVYGVGISINNTRMDEIEYFNSLTPNLVFHLILGINDFIDVGRLYSMDNKCKILLLGYKNFGRGISYYSGKVRISLESWKYLLPHLLGRIHLSFDNLAIEQMELKKLLSAEQWEQFYMGDDFTFTMYMDAVKQVYAPTSTSEERVPFGSLINYFRKRRRVCLT